MVYFDMTVKVYGKHKYSIMRKIFTFQNIALLLLIIYIFSGYYSCPYKLITGVDCAGCGMTRAMFALLRFDFAAARMYHPCVFLIVFDGVYFMLHKAVMRKFAWHRIMDGVVIVTTLIALVITRLAKG